MATQKKGRGRPKKNKTPETGTEAGTGEDQTTKRPKQLPIPGTERPSIKEIDEAAEAYVNVRDKRQELTKKEVAAKQALSDLMHKHADQIGKDADGGLTYRYDDMAVILKPTEEQLKVKHVDEDEAGVTVGKAPADTTEGEA